MTRPSTLGQMSGQTTIIRSLLRFCAVTVAFAPHPASAHVGVGDTHSFIHGFSHPLGGIDHVLAMVAVGLFAAHLGGRALWLVPLTFVFVMALAGIAGMGGVQLPVVGIGIGMLGFLFCLGGALSICVPTVVAFGLVWFFL